MARFESKLVPQDKLAEWMGTARDRLSFAEQMDGPDRALALDDANFALAEPYGGGGTSQWSAGSIQSRNRLRRPCLTENRMLTFTAQVVNDGRQSKPAIAITALDDGTKETAEYFQGRIRHIEYDCDADIAYDSAREQQVTCGRAFIRVNWEYEYKKFRRRINIERIENQFSVYFGPARKYDCSDADYCFVINSITKDEHERKYGKETTVAHTDFASPQNPAPNWIGIGTNGQMVQEAEYWEKSYDERTLALLTDGTVQWKDEIPVPDDVELAGQATQYRNAVIEEERTENDYKVVQYIIDGADILAETEFPGQYIPIVPQWGREYFLDGTRRTLSLIRQAKDPQRLLNLYVSNIAEQISMMPKTPYWVPVGGIPAGANQVYEKLNDEPRAYVPYNARDIVTGQPLPPPSRETAEPPIAALVQGYNQCVDAIKAAMGIYDPSLGNAPTEQSGIAIKARQHQSDNANFHFHDNESRTRRQLGRIILPLVKLMDSGVQWPKDDDEPAKAHFIGDHPVRTEDGKTKLVHVGESWRDPDTRKTVHHDLERGDYGVAVSTGPSYTSQRDEAFDQLTKMAQAWPALLQVGGPTILRLANFPGSDKLADLMEKTLPPALQSSPDGQPPLPPQVQAQFEQIQQQASMVIKGLRETVEKQEEEIQKLSLERAGKVLDNQSKMDLAKMQIEAQLASAEITTKFQQMSERQDLFYDMLKKLVDHAHAAGLQAQDHAHKAAMQDVQNQQQTSLQSTDHQQQADMQQSQQDADAAQAAQPDASAEPEPAASPASAGPAQ